MSGVKATEVVMTESTYGKDLVKVARVVREGNTHHVVEYIVRALLVGDFDRSYSHSDNSNIVATDTVKNTVYILAKTSPHVLDPPAFALHVALHFIEKYSWVEKTHVEITSLKWSRIQFEGKGHDHSFLRDGDEKVVVTVDVDASSSRESPKVDLVTGLKGLLVLKTGGSSFEGYYKNEHTTLGEVKDRLFSTEVQYTYKIPLPPNTPATISNLPSIASSLDFSSIAKTVRHDTLDIFANTHSASVQATIWDSAHKVLEDAKEISEISYTYPNKHYIPVNLSPFGLDNGLGVDGGAEVFWPAADPSGLIKATFARS